MVKTSVKNEEQRQGKGPQYTTSELGYKGTPETISVGKG